MKKEEMDTYAKYVRPRFEQGNLIVEISKDAFRDDEAKKEAVKELRQLIKTYFGLRFFIRLSIVYAFTALFCASVALAIILVR
ncbi:MAG: hypothetical protein EJNHJLOP_00033 [Methanophagales virus PBV082]|uniref:Uncharacterized protein n=1 Tax=Methanophagales virus PBV082 TaxID=3071307 RepID=A0AA46YJA5_9VIRU|nr:MAG: hypothetical protein QIT52_gp33 [Methanophagales virus PBV082]UYL64922.1 MAG: hypothetical protein EJNHJLOP_00033 [Methanophagales virus PBV082]